MLQKWLCLMNLLFAFDLTLLNFQTIQEIIEKKYVEKRERVKMEVQQAVAVSITANRWTSVNMDAYLALICHYIIENVKLCTSVLGVQDFQQSHTADNFCPFWPKSKGARWMTGP